MHDIDYWMGGKIEEKKAADDAIQTAISIEDFPQLHFFCQDRKNTLQLKVSFDGKVFYIKIDERLMKD